MNEQGQSEAVIRCEEVEALAILYACGEADSAARVALEAHAAKCPSCASVVQREVRMREAIALLEPPAESLDRSGLLLAQCRGELAEALDDQEVHAGQQNARVGVLSPVRWWNAFRHSLVYHPALSMAVLVMAGFLAGVGGQRWRAMSSAPPRPVVTVSAAPKVTEQQLQSAGSANVSWVMPAGSRVPTVDVQLMSQTPMSIVGSADDADVRHALTFVLANGERFNPDARLDSLEVLQTLSQDIDVRSALCSAARTDRNPGVRIKALETLQGFERDAQVRGTLIAALENDGNSGVRVEAMNLLLNALPADGESGPADPAILAAFRDRLRNDPNNYIRLQSAAALRQLGSSELP